MTLRRTKPPAGKPHIFQIAPDCWRVRVYTPMDGGHTVVAKSENHAREIARREYDSYYYRSNYQPNKR